MTNTEFTAQFEQFAPQLKSFILRMTANVQDTEDIFQDAWIKAAEKLHTFRGESSLKTWVFAIASNLTIDNLRKRKRWPENVTDICREASHSDPHVVQKSIESFRHPNMPNGKFANILLFALRVFQNPFLLNNIFAFC